MRLILVICTLHNSITNRLHNSDLPYSEIKNLLNWCMHVILNFQNIFRFNEFCYRNSKQVSMTKFINLKTIFSNVSYCSI